MDYADRSIPIEDRWLDRAIQTLKQEILHSIKSGNIDVDEAGNLSYNYQDLSMGCPSDLYGDEYSEWRDYDDNYDVHDNWVSEAAPRIKCTPDFPYQLHVDEWDNIIHIINKSPYPVYLVRNDFYGDIFCELVHETPQCWFFNYSVDGNPILKNWRVYKRASRIIRKASVDELR